MATIYEQTTVRVRGTFTNFNGIVLDPVTVTVRYEDPSNNTATSVYSVGEPGWTHPEVGVYGFDILVDEDGTWQYSFEGIDPITSYNEGRFTVAVKGF